MKHLAPLLVALALLTSAGGCSSSGSSEADPSTRPAAKVVVPERIGWHGWDAWRLRNDSVEVIVVPAIARVMRYGPTGTGDAGNVLWTNPRVAGELPRADGWQNFGGDKAWPWPQADWADLFGSTWPPPAPFEGVAWKGEVVDNVLRLIGPPAPTYGIRPVRTVVLDPEGSGLTVTTTFEPIRETPVARPDGDLAVPADAGAWHITQVPRRDTTLVAVAPYGRRAAPKWLGDPADADRLEEFVRPLGDNAHSATPLADVGGKAGFDATVLAAGLTRANRPLAFVQRLVSATGSRYLEPTDAAQIFSMADDAGGAGAVPGWSELEFTAPIGGTSKLVVRWLLEEVEPETVADPAQLARTARQLADADARTRR